MKKIFLFLLVALFSFGNSWADIEDDSIIKELEKENVQKLNFDFKLKKFESCENLEDVMSKYIEDYWENNKRRYAYPVLYKSLGNVDMMADDVDMAIESSAEVSDGIGSGGSGGDFSETNVQVQGVDESDIIKTDGKYVYYFNEKDKNVYIVDADSLEIIKKIKLPNSFYNPVLYLGKNRLVILSGGYSQTNYTKLGYWINRSSKTYAIVFDTTDIKSPKLLKLSVLDGDFTKSRKIGDKLYVISNSRFDIPYYSFKKVDDIQIEEQSIIPKKVEITQTSDTKKQNLSIKNKKLPYEVTAGNVASCDEIEYALPDEETLKQYEFSPSYNIISIIDINDTSKKIKTKVIAGDNTEIYMSLDNLYLISYIYQNARFSCPAGAYCILPWYSVGQNTLVHKINIVDDTLEYQDSTIIPGSPLTQYSMDEYKGDFRIVTSQWNPRQTDLYILDEDLELKSSLTGLGKTEDFKSSRFIGDKLFLVTFKQIDPLFAIDVADSKNPKVLGELKIPGYSTYLHPYDDTHLIGIGYNTSENQHGGTFNNGLKIDLYQVNYDKKCGDIDLSVEEQAKCESGDYKGIIVKQLHSLTLGEFGSDSEALHNPRMFMWNAAKKLLLLPATTYINEEENYYNHKDFFQGLYGIQIDKDKGIKEKYSLSHIDRSGLEEAREKECKEYTTSNEPVCKELIGGGTYCEPARKQYIPKYCYVGSSVGEYISYKSWEFRNDFIKRALWIGNDIYAISNNNISTADIESGKEEKRQELK